MTETKKHETFTLCLFAVLLTACLSLCGSGCGGGVAAKPPACPPGACCVDADCGYSCSCCGSVCYNTWAKNYGGEKEDFFNGIRQTSDGGYIAVGQTKSSGAALYNAWVVKTAADGKQEWPLPFTIGGSEDDAANDVVEAWDGGYLIAGFSESWVVGSQGWLIKIDDKGNYKWDQNFGEANIDDGFKSIDRTDDGNYILGGFTGNPAKGWVFKSDSSGKMIWQKMFGYDGIDQINMIKTTPEGGFVFVGTGNSNNKYKIMVSKLDRQGNEKWGKLFGESGNDYGFAIDISPNGGYIVTGSVASDNDPGNIYVLKLDSAGNEIWGKSFGNTGIDIGKSVIAEKDGSFVVAGETRSLNSGIESDLSLMKLDSEGNLLWWKAYGVSGVADYGFSLARAWGGGYVIAGLKTFPENSNVDGWLVKTDPCGNLASQ